VPFRRIIDRSNGTPWPQAGMTTQRWIDEVQPRHVQIRDLIATQPHVILEALTDTFMRDDAQAWSRDPYPHVVSWRGDLYLEDGHHRAIRALLRNEAAMLARVLHLDDA